MEDTLVNLNEVDIKQVKKRVKVPVTSFTRKAKLTQNMAISLLWIAAAITIAILVMIIGYIIYRGFVSDLKKEYPVITAGTFSVPLDEAGQYAISFIINKDVRLKELTVKDIMDLYTGEEKYWTVSEQYLNVHPFSLSLETPLGKLFSEKLFGEDSKLARSHSFQANEKEMINQVAQTPGAIGYVSTAGLGDKDMQNKVKVISVRLFSPLANKDVLAIHDNRRLSYLTSTQLKNIIEGKINDWQEAGGPAGPVSVFTFPPEHPWGKTISSLLLEKADNWGHNTFFVSDTQELLAKVNSTPGAIGFLPYWEIYHQLPEKKGLTQVINIERHEVKQNLNWHFLAEEPKKSGAVGGIITIIFNTIFMIFLTLLFATPLGIGAAIYLTEYAKQKNLITILRFFTETLAGVPSIIFGLFGYLVFVNYFNLKMGLLSGTLTLTLMILPTIIRTSEEAFKAVPKEFRIESLALGATLWQTIRGVIIPSAMPGILTGVILGIGRAIGETAAVLFTMGSSYTLAKDLFSSARVLSLHLFLLTEEGISFERAFATATLLIFIILIVNLLTNNLVGRMNKLKLKSKT